MKALRPQKLTSELWKKRTILTEKWFTNLKGQMCKSFLNIENEFNIKNNLKKKSFKKNYKAKVILVMKKLLPCILKIHPSYKLRMGIEYEAVNE